MKVAVALELLVMLSYILLAGAQRAFVWKAQFTPRIGEFNQAGMKRYHTLLGYFAAPNEQFPCC
ncbi:hypothetical protein Alg215_11202 [Pyrenophora tritici-repentis]|nr:hypothetical protein Alg215_11202 [Pyrenophora tritici-repentis]